MAQPSYEEMLYSIESYFGSNSDVWLKIDNGGRTYDDILNAYSNIPRMQSIVSDSGDNLSWTYADPINLVASDINNPVLDFDSNLGGSSYGGDYTYNFDIPSNWSYDGTDYSTTTGLVDPVSGVGMMTVLDKVSLAKTGASLGCKLGVAIDEALYSIDPEWWDTHYPNINPQKWPSLVTTTPEGKSFFCSLFGIKNDTVTGYMDERALAYTYMLLRDEGALDTSYNASYDGSTASFANPDCTTLSPIYSSVIVYSTLRTFVLTADAGVYLVTCKNSSSGGINVIPFAKTSGKRVRTQTYRPGTTTIEYDYYTNVSTTVRSRNGNTYYIGSAANVASSQILTPVPDLSYPYLQNNEDMVTILFDGSINETSDVPGIRFQDNATVPDKSVITGTDVDVVLQQLKNNYPDLFTGTKTLTVPQNDGSLKTYNYVPVPFANETTSTSEEDKDKIITDELTQTDTEVGEQTFTKEFLKTPTTDTPDTGDGSGPSMVIPTGNASSLWAVYHPSQAQLNAFGAWLWSSDFVDQLKRLFNDPMQAIIGVHKVFAPIPTGGNQNIKCGYLDSGVSSPTVSAQYTDVNCGSVYCGEYFGNALDYDPHTRISIYLPFIGVVPLKTSEVMRSTVSVTYGVDVITGACLAKVNIVRDGGGAILYSYGGSCACHYPISSGSYAGIISGIVTSAIGIAGGIATGNPLAAVGGAIAGVRQAHTEVQHSGGFTGCSGAMGPKKPYLIIVRPQARIANNVGQFIGIPSNSTERIGDCNGYVKIKKAHVKSEKAYKDELSEIERLLFEGVIISD